MIKDKLALINDKPNVFEFPQSTIDALKVSDEDKELFIDTIKIFMPKSKDHFTYKFVDYHIQTGLKFIDIAKISKYPLPAAYNRTTKRCVINLSAFGRKSVGNLNARDLYATLVYGHVCSFLSAGIEIPEENADPFCEFIIQILLGMVAKKYGLTGPYVDKILHFRFFTACYIYVSFFGMTQTAAMKRAEHFSKTSAIKTFSKDISKYDFTKLNDFLLALSENDVTPGLTPYRFLDYVIKNFGPINLPFFEDIMRFSSTMVASTVNGNTYYPERLQMYNQKLYFKVNSTIETIISKKM